MNKKRIKLAALILCVTLLVTACSGGGGGGGEGQSSGRNDLIIGVARDAETFDPYRTFSSTASIVVGQIYESLFNRAPDGTMELLLAESYEHPSPLEWVVKIKEGVKFHNGEEVTAEDVKASLDYARIKHSSIVSAKTVEVIGPYEVKITTETPNRFLIEGELSRRFTAITPKSLIDHENDFNKNPVGSGPYVIEEQATSEFIRLKKFEDYRADPVMDGRVDTILIKVIPEGSSRTIALENGEIDIIDDVETMDVQKLVDNPKINVDEFVGARVYNLTINCESPNLDNVLVRKAIAYGINADAALAVGINGMGTVTRGTLMEGQLGYTTNGLPTYDPEFAKQCLEEAGVAPGEITFEVMSYKANYTTVAESIQADLKEIGINVTIANVEDAVFLERTANGTFDTAIIGQTGWDDPHFLFQSIYHTAGIGASNRCRYSDPDVDVAIDGMPVTATDEELGELMGIVAEKVQNSYVVLPMFMDTTYVPYAKGLTNVYANLSGRVYPERVRWE